MTETAAQQFMDASVAIRMTGPDGVVITQAIIEPQDLKLSNDIRWVASTRLRQKLSKSQQFLNLLNIAIGIPPEVQRSQGFKIKYKELFVDAANGLTDDNAEKYVEDLTVSLPGIPPELEEEFTNAGRPIEAAVGETIEYHLAHIQAHMTMPMPNSELAKLRKMELIRSHQSRIEDLQQQQLLAAQEAAQNPSSVPGGADRGPVGGSMPVRPQEQPTYSTEGAASQGILSQGQ